MKNAMNTHDLMDRVPLFSGLPSEDRRDLASIATAVSFQRGQNVFLEGDPAERFFAVTTGRVKIFKLSADGKEQILHMLGPGELFGEAPVFSGQPYPASADAVAATTALCFPRGAFRDLIARNPGLSLDMMAVLSRRLHEFTDMIEQLSLREVPERLANYFLYYSTQLGGIDAFELDVTKTQLASFLGTIPETLSRVLARMDRRGLISLSGQRRITLRDREALERLARAEDRLR